MLKFKNQDAYEARFRALQIVDERAAVKSVNGVLPDDAGAITLTPADINAVSVEDIANIRGTFRINVTSSNGVYSADKTFDEIKAAYDAGQQPYVVYTSLTSNFIYTLAMATPKFMSFESYSISGDTLETVSLRIFSYTLDNGSNIEQQISPYDIPSLEGYATEAYVQNYHDNTKQDIITDLATIRSGASKGATALQSVPATYRTAAAQDVIDNTKLTDAPTDGKAYARKNGSWHEIAVVDVDALQSKSITDSGGHFTSDTVEGALQEIGAELAGINTLLGSGIQISFTIDDGGSGSETFSVVSGTTWAEWIGTGRLIFNDGLMLYIYGGVVATEAGVYAVSLDGSTAVDGSDKIVSGATYTIINWGG